MIDNFFFISKNTNILDINSSTRGTVQNTHQHHDMQKYGNLIQVN